MATIVLRLVGVGLIIFYGRALVRFTNGWLALRAAPTRMKSIAAELFVGGTIALLPLALGAGFLWWWAPRGSMRPGRGIVLSVVGGLLAVGGPLMLHAAYRGRRDPQWAALLRPMVSLAIGPSPLRMRLSVAIVVYEMIERYYGAGKPELITDRAEWRALVLLDGALERSGLAHFENYRELLADARRSLAEYEGIPF